MALMRVKLLFLIISIVSSFQLVHARVQQPKESDEVIKICTELVVVDAHVLRKTGEVVRDLTKDDFILFEDGVEQQITHFSQDRLPMSIVLLLDLSGSVIWEVIQDRARRTFERLRPEDEIALMLFDTEAF